MPSTKEKAYASGYGKGSSEGYYKKPDYNINYSMNGNEVGERK